ncbi:MAG TPA: peptidase domain-containing ABC transporter [Azospirillaceae bacterium]|nr:peptidase domain-containing ABC transporter [Azospirillaceae bacterium]
MTLDAGCAHTAVSCLAMAARLRGIATSREQLIHDHGLGGQEPAVPHLLRIATSIGLRARARTLAWSDLFRLGDAYPVLVRLRNGNMMLAVGATEQSGTQLLLVQDPLAEDAGALALDESRFTAAWDGTVLFVKRAHDTGEQERPFDLAWFLPELLRNRRLFRDVAVATLLLGGLGIAMPVFTQQVLDKVLVHHSLDTLWVLAGGMLLAVLFETVFGYLRQYVTLFAANKIDAHVTVRTFNKLTSLPMDFFERTPTGVLLKNMVQSERIRGFLIGPLFMAVLDLVMLAVFVPLLFFFSPVLASIVLGFTLLLCLCTLVTLPVLRRRLPEVYRVEARQQSFLVETIQGMRTVKSLALDARQRQEWDRRVGATIRTRFGVAKLAMMLTALTAPIEKMMTIVVVATGAYLVLQGEMLVGALIAFNMLSGRVTQPLVQLSQLLPQFQEVSLSVGMLGTIMNHPSEQGRVVNGPRIPFRGEIEFQDIRFRYAGAATPALDALSFKIPAGTIFGIVGKSGSGKTTVTRLLQGLHAPQEGLIKIDGYDIREVGIDHLRASVGTVLQESFLFTGTIRENIAIGRPAATTAEIMRAMRLAGADEFVERLPAGINTPLDEGSANLSGGQRQRLAIARALLRDPPILILDEATSALDAESEAIIQANLMSIAQGRTLIIVSHRLSSLVPAHNILVLDQGRAADIGSHGDLLQRCPIYRNLWRQQNRHASYLDYDMEKRA